MNNNRMTPATRRKLSESMTASWARRRAAEAAHASLVAAVPQPNALPLPTLYEAAEKLTDDYEALKQAIVNLVTADIIVAALEETNHGGTRVQTDLRKLLVEWIEAQIRVQ